MLGKLFITPNSNPEKTQVAMDLVAEAIDLKITGDALSRNALTKFHSSLAKIMGENPVSKQNEPGQGVTVLENEPAMATDEGDVETPPLGTEEETKMDPVADEGYTEVKDSILDELLDDEEEEV